MAALSANATTPPRPDPSVPHPYRTYKATGADEYYDGAIVCHTSGKVLVTNADATTCVGIFLGRLTATAADDPVRVFIRGLWWIAAADMVDGELWGLKAPTAASDNPADLITQTAGTPSALGTLVHVDVTATSGWVDLDQRVVVANS